MPKLQCSKCGHVGNWPLPDHLHFAGDCHHAARRSFHTYSAMLVGFVVGALLVGLLVPYEACPEREDLRWPHTPPRVFGGWR